MCCDFNIALTALASPNCSSASFFNQKDSVTDLCDFRFKTNVLPTAMFELLPSHLLLYKTTLLALDCAKGQQILKGCFFCVVKIPCRCSVTANNLYLPPRLDKCNNNTEDITILHPVKFGLTSTTRIPPFSELPFLKNLCTSSYQIFTFSITPFPKLIQ